MNGCPSSGDASRPTPPSPDPHLIRDMHHYCDRWCERCPQTARCLSFRLEQSGSTAGGRYWDGVARNGPGDGQADQDEPPRRATPIKRTAERDDGAFPGRDGGALHRQAQGYRQAARSLVQMLPDALQEIEAELRLQTQLGTGSPEATAAQIRNALEVIEWYVYFIEVKLRRALASQAEESEAGFAGQVGDADGSAKVALLAIDRSLQAWTTLRSHTARHHDAILDVLVRLDRLRHAVERVFPRARQFRRPGLD